MKLGTYAIEQDYSQYVAKSSEIILGIVGTATKGPVNTPTVCTSPQDLINKFGNLSPDCLGLYAGQYFLAQSSKLWYVRAATESAKESTVNIAGKTAGNVAVEEALTFKAKTPGTFYDGYQVVVTIQDNETPDNPKFMISISNAKGQTLETIRFIDLKSLLQDSVVVDNIKSNYITLTAVSSTITAITPGTYTLSGGDDGIDSISSAEYIQAMQTLSNDNIDINLLSIPGVSDAAVVVATLAMVEERGDALYLVDPPNNLDANTVAQWHNGEGDYEHERFNSSYGALYWSWQKIYDSYNRIYIEVPPSVIVAPTIARSTRMSEIWYAPAGLQRGVVSGVLSPVTVPTSGDRDMLYSGDNSVNCIISDPQVGLCVFGQKTLSRMNTALDRVNVRMLLNYLKRIIVAACRHLTFEPNDRITWNNFEDKIEPTLRGIKDHRGIYEYKIVKGETIVTDTDIDNYRMPCMILIRPTKAVEEIPIYFTITSTGADFNDVMEANGIVVEDY